MNLAQNRRAAFSLTEVTVALAVAAFCLVAVFGLLPVGVTSNQASIQQTAAAGLTRAIISDLRAAQLSVPVSGTSRLYQIPIPGPAATSNLMATLYLKEDGSPAITPGAAPSATDPVYGNANGAQNPRYRATIFFTPPPTGQRIATQVRILVTWPAMADPVAASMPANYSGSYETLTALDRN